LKICPKFLKILKMCPENFENVHKFFCKFSNLENVPKKILKFCKSIVTYSGSSIHDGSLLHSKFNTHLLITVHNSSRILTLVWQVLGLQQMRVMSTGF
jgi:hypothetical protein